MQQMRQNHERQYSSRIIDYYASKMDPTQPETWARSPYSQRFDQNAIGMMNIGVLGHRKELMTKKRETGPNAQYQT